jgi:glycosyltransferase involved in cell wall biosynthesis
MPNELAADRLPRILFISNTADWTGPTNSLLLLLKHLSGNFRVAVLLPGNGRFSQVLMREGFQYFSLPSLSKWSIPSMFRLIRRERFDLVYGNSNDSCSRNALIAAKTAGVRFVCHVRAMATGKAWHRLAHLSFADAVIAVSQSCADSLRRGVSIKRLNVVHNGIDLDRFPADSQMTVEAFRTELQLSEGTPVIISTGHLMVRKGQEYAIRAVDACRTRGMDLQLLLVGSHDREESYVERIKNMVADMGLAKMVRMTGFRPDVHELLSLADIYVHTAQRDPHPRAVLEAMAAGLPVVAFAVDGVVETVVHCHTGYLVPSGDIDGMTDAILKLAANPALRKRMGQAGRQRVETCFSAAGTAEKVGRIIRMQLQPSR